MTSNYIRMLGGEVLDICGKAKVNIQAERDKRIREAKSFIETQANKKVWWWPFKQSHITADDIIKNPEHYSVNIVVNLNELTFAKMFCKGILDTIADLEISIDNNPSKELLLTTETVSLLKKWS